MTREEFDQRVVRLLKTRSSCLQYVLNPETADTELAITSEALQFLAMILIAETLRDLVDAVGKP